MPSRFFRTFVNPFRRDSLEREVEDEISFHLEQKERDLIDAGVDRSEARRRARAEFGPVGQWRRESVKIRKTGRRRGRRIEWRNSWTQDLRHAVRGLVRNPTLTLAAVSTLALGIGANTAIYSVAHAVIFRPLPYPEPDRLVAIWLRERGDDGRGDGETADRGFAYADFEDYRDRSSTLSDMAFMTNFAADFHGERPVRVIGHTVPASYFDLLGVRAALGRTLIEADDDRPESDRAVVLTHAFWSSHLGGDPEVVGRTFRTTTQGRSGFFTVVGVLPKDFEQAPGFNSQTGLTRGVVDLFTSSTTDPVVRTRRGGGARSVYARIAEGRSLEEARTEMRSISAGLAEAYPEQDRGLEAVVMPLHALRRQVFGRDMALLMGAAGLVLLIACADVGGLLLISGNGRRREMSVRAALGSGRWRLIRLMMTEAFVLAVVGATAGVLLARWLQPAVVSLLPRSMPGANRVEIDVGVLAFATVLALCTLLLSAVLPAFRATRLDVSRELKMTEQSATGRSGLVSRLVVLQVSLATVLLLCGVLFAKSFLRLAGVEQGFTDERVLIARIAQRTESTDFDRLRVWDAVLRETRMLPGVVAVSLASHAPIQNAAESFLLRVPDRPGLEVRTLGWGVSQNYFDALGIPLVRGVGIPRWDSDALPAARRGGVGDWWNEDWGAFLPETHRVAVVSESLARTAFPDRAAVGQLIRLGNSPPLRIVGIAQDLHALGPDHRLRQRLDTSFQVYVSRALWPWRAELMIQTADDPSTHLSAIRDAVRAADPDLAVAQFITMEQRRRDEFARPRLYVTVVGFFALISVALATVGLYGVLASSVQGRTREIGLRMALGARREQLRRDVLRRSLVLSTLGLAFGVAGALALSRVLDAFLYDLPPVDPIAYLMTAAGILLVAGLACYLPARRATQIDPLMALRHE